MSMGCIFPKVFPQHTWRRDRHSGDNRGRRCQGDFNEHLEIIGNGNITKAEGKVKIHLHIAGGNENGVKAGHLIGSVVTVFCEVVIRILRGFAMERKMDKKLLSQGVLNPYVLQPWVVV